jgi:hypothetical protein
LETTGEEVMGHIQFLNQDGEWEQFPTAEEEQNLRDNAAALEELGYKLICQMCNSVPNWNQIRERWLLKEWTCTKCHTVNSAGRA